MARSEKHIERLIVRYLDGELSADDRLELDRELVRNPGVRRLMEDYRRIDELSTAALENALGSDRMTLEPTALPARGPAHESAGSVRRYGRVHDSMYALRWLVPGAVAAALLAIVVARFPLASSPDPSVAEGDRQGVNAMGPIVRPASDAPGVMRTVGTCGRRIKRGTGREILGVVGEDGNIYWIEVDRTLTVRQPKQAMHRSIAEEM